MATTQLRRPVGLALRAFFAAALFGAVAGGIAGAGAALAAGVTAGIWQNLAETVPLIRAESVTEPISANFPVYEKQYQAYIKFYDALKWSFRF